MKTCAAILLGLIVFVATLITSRLPGYYLLGPYGPIYVNAVPRAVTNSHPR